MKQAKKTKKNVSQCRLLGGNTYTKLLLCVKRGTQEKMRCYKYVPGTYLFRGTRQLPPARTWEHSPRCSPWLLSWPRGTPCSGGARFCPCRRRRKLYLPRPRPRCVPGEPEQHRRRNGVTTGGRQKQREEKKKKKPGNSARQKMLQVHTALGLETTISTTDERLPPMFSRGDVNTRYY